MLVLFVTGSRLIIDGAAAARAVPDIAALKEPIMVQPMTPVVVRIKATTLNTGEVFSDFVEADYEMAT